MASKLTRRGFMALGGSLVAATALSGCAPSGESSSDEGGASAVSTYADGKITAPELEASSVKVDPIDDIVEELEFDVVVVGAGTAGVPAALSAYEAGAKVAVLQKEPTPIAQGMLAARVVKGSSTEVGIAEYLHEMHVLNDHRPDFSLLKQYADSSEEALDWYEAKLAEASFDAYSESDSLDHVYEDGNCYVKGILFPDSMKAPTTALAEMAAQNTDIQFFYSTPAVQLVQDGTAVTGVIGETQDGYKKFIAKKGIILATGDYQNNDAMVQRYVVDAMPFMRKQSNKTGDGHLMGLLAGAVMEPGCHCKMIHAQGAGCFREEPLLAVNMNGERFMYEDVAYGARSTILRDQPQNRMITIFDANYSEQIYGWGSDPTVPTVANGTPEKIAGYVEAGSLFKADTIEELAEAAGLPVDATVATVERYNELCALGADLDFGKASKYMQPVDTAPFYAQPRDFCVSAIPAGLVIDANGQCKDANGELIPGLFAAGNCSGPFYSATDYSLSTMGLSVGRCITFGYVTGRYVASL